MTNICKCPECKTPARVLTMENTKKGARRYHRCKFCEINYVSIDWKFSYTVVPGLCKKDGIQVICECGSRMGRNSEAKNKIYFLCKECGLRRTIDSKDLNP